MGRYSVAYDVTTLPSEELINPVVTALFPVMVKVQRDPVKRIRNLPSVLYWSALLCVSTTWVLPRRGRHGRSGPRAQMGRRQTVGPWLALSSASGDEQSMCAPPWIDRASCPSAGLQWVRLIGLARDRAAGRLFFKTWRPSPWAGSGRRC